MDDSPNRIARRIVNLALATAVVAGGPKGDAAELELGARGEHVLLALAVAALRPTLDAAEVRLWARGTPVAPPRFRVLTDVAPTS